MRLIITRHGRTEENDLGILQGHLPGKLSLLGIEQAKKLAIRLKDEKIDYIYSSDLARAADTAKEIAKYHPNAKIEFSKDLRERYFGEWQGKTKTELGLLDNITIKNNFPKDGETFESLYARTNNFLNNVLENNINDAVLFVSHDETNISIIAGITSKSFDKIKTYNASISIYEIDKNKQFKIIIENNISHLK